MPDRVLWRLAGLAFLGLIACSPEKQAEPFVLIAGPKEVLRFQVDDEEGLTLWAFEARSPRTLDHVLFGIVPAGFAQVEPPGDRPPRFLVPGELLRVETLTRRRRFTHIGIARSDTGMEILNYSMELVDP